MHNIVISGTGLYTPRNSISNDELVDSFNAYVRLFNAEHAPAKHVDCRHGCRPQPCCHRAEPEIERG